MNTDPIRRIGDMWNQTTGQWWELGMRFNNGEPYGEQYFRPRPSALTESRPTGKGIWKPVLVKKTGALYP